MCGNFFKGRRISVTCSNRRCATNALRLLRVDCVPLPNSQAEVLTPVPQDVTLFGKRVVVDVISSDEVILE